MPAVAVLALSSVVSFATESEKKVEVSAPATEQGKADHATVKTEEKHEAAPTAQGTPAPATTTTTTADGGASTTVTTEAPKDELKKEEPKK